MINLSTNQIDGRKREMAKILYKLGKWSFRSRKTVLGGTLVLLLLAVAAGLGIGPAFEAGMSIPGIKSEKAMKVMGEAFGNTSESGGTIQLIYKAPGNDTLESETIKKLIQITEQEIVKDQNVASVTSLFDAKTVSRNQRIGYSTITYKVGKDDVTQDSINHVLEVIKEPNRNGLQTELGGSVTLNKVSAGGIAEIIGVIIAFLILVLTFGSFVAAGFPILSAILSLGVGTMLILIGTNFLSIPSFSLSLAGMLGLAVGIDYGLFIITRFRQNLQTGMSREEAAGQANATAGSAVVFAGITVIIALLGLNVTGVPFLGAMGIAGAITVFVAVVMSLLFIPALLGCSKKLFVPKKTINVQYPPRFAPKPSNSNWWGRFITKYPLSVLLVSVLFLGLISLPMLHLHTGLPNNGTKSEETTERRAYDLISEGFGAGFNGPLIIVAQAITEATKGLSILKNVASVTPPQLNAAGDTAILTMLPQTGPLDVKTSDLVNTIRDQAESIKEQYHVELMVTGSTAVDIDISDKLNKALPKFAAIIVGLAVILLAIVFRSIIIPIKAVLGYLLTLTATLGFLVFVVQDGNLINLIGIAEPAPVLNFLPILVASILFGLAMDYEVFLVSGMRESYIKTKDPQKAILHGLKSSSKVVVVAGLIMVSVFASFIFAEDTIVKSMGLALAFGIVFDAFIVRLIIVPAAMTLLGKSAWYFPNWLDRILPKIDIEGESFHEANSKEEDPIVLIRKSHY
jgi:membrane protein YdfJ